MDSGVWTTTDGVVDETRVAASEVVVLDGLEEVLDEDNVEEEEVDVEVEVVEVAEVVVGWVAVEEVGVDELVDVEELDVVEEVLCAVDVGVLEVVVAAGPILNTGGKSGGRGF